MNAVCYDAIEGDTGKSLRLTLKDKETGLVVDITGGTVTLHWYDKTGVAVSRTMTIVDAVNGIASYQFAAGELFQPGLYYQPKFVDAGGNIIRSECVNFFSVGQAIV